MHALVSIVCKWSLLPPTIGVNSHSPRGMKLSKQVYEISNLLEISSDDI